MGGALFHPGNANSLAEANFFWDPDAVNIVFKSKIPIYIIPLNISDYVPLELDRILNQSFKIFIDKLFKKYNYHYKYEKKYFLSPKNNFKKEIYKAGCLHDPLVVTSIINPKIINFTKIFVSTQNIHNPRGFVYPVIRNDQPNDDCYQLNVAVVFNKDLFWKTINQLLT